MGANIDLPELEWGAHLVDSLMEFGPVLSGPVPVPFSEIDSWSRVTRIYLPAEDAVLLRQLSRDYCGELLAARDRNRPKPPMPDEDGDNSAALAQGFQTILKRFKK